MTKLGCIFALAAALAAQPAAGALGIFACEPEWGALAKDVGGDRVSIYVATTARQDPHRIEARPSLIARARSADLVVCTGAGLEAGWLPLVLAQSANPKIQNGQPGFFEAARYVAMREVPQQVDRAQGDIHAAGNPHIHLDPRNIAKVAAALADRLSRLDAAGSGLYQVRIKTFLERWQQAVAEWEKRAASLRGAPVVVHHRDFTYLIAWLGLREVGTLEPKPGLPPTTAHLSELLARLARDPAKMIVRSAYSDPRAAEWLAERAKIPVVTLPYTVGGSDTAQDLITLFDDTLSRLLEAVK